jgi:ribosomal protein S18 acetylase RimI-like enzyme
MVGEVRAHIRADRRCFLRFRDCADCAYKPLIAAVAREIPADLFVTVEGSDIRTQRLLRDVGFVVHRREPVYAIPTDPTVTGLRLWRPEGITFVSAADADEARLRSLDDALRQDIPGTEGWRWTEDAFRETTFRDDAFDPATYVVAVDESSGQYVGLARVWWRETSPRLGMIGVLREYRRRGIARALLAEVLAAVHQRCQPTVFTEIDETNVASTSLVRSIGARPEDNHIHVELRRRGATGLYLERVDD